MSTPKTETEKFSHQLIELYGKLSSWEQDVVKNSSLSPAQMHTIEIVGHETGGSALRMKELAKKMGRDSFDAFLRDYCARYKWGIASSDGFKELAEEQCACDLTPLFDAWVR